MPTTVNLTPEVFGTMRLLSEAILCRFVDLTSVTEAASALRAAQDSAGWDQSDSRSATVTLIRSAFLERQVQERLVAHNLAVQMSSSIARGCHDDGLLKAMESPAGASETRDATRFDARERVGD